VSNKWLLTEKKIQWGEIHKLKRLLVPDRGFFTKSYNWVICGGKELYVYEIE
jgi:hypothetical protein